MTGIEILQFLWEAGKTAYEIATGIKTKKLEDRKKIADLFDHIGKLLHETYLELNKGNYPYGHCRQIEIFAEGIKGKTINGEIVEDNYRKELGTDEADKLGDLLFAAFKVESLAKMIRKGEVNKRELIKVEESSGEFIAASKLIMF